MKRRDFVYRSSAVASCALQANSAADLQNFITLHPKPGTPLIKSLTLLTTTSLDEMKKFYGDLV